MTSNSGTKTRRSFLKDILFSIIICALLTKNFYSQQIELSTIQAGLFPDHLDGADQPTAASAHHGDAQSSLSLSDLTASTPSSHGIEANCQAPSRWIQNRDPSNAETATQQQPGRPELQQPQKRRIPKIVHMTSKSRCTTQAFAGNMQKWMFDDHAFFFHDDEAVERLLQRHWDDFPHLSLVRKCLRSGAATADLWRYLVLWEYGGIYTDIDNAPGRLWNSTLIAQDDDAFFVVEHLGVLSQYFMAASPKHPVMYLAVQNALHRILDVEHVGRQNVPQVTGPGALKMAFKHFMRTHNVKKYGRVQAGHYVGLDGRSVTVVGGKYNSTVYVSRAVVSDKGGQYKAMGMVHFNGIPKKKFNESCFVHMWNLDHGADPVNLTGW